MATPTSPAKMTIGRLARAADVGIETIRYYQRLALLPTPEPTEGSAFRHYPLALVDRIRFIKRSQDLGFSLDQISALLKLEDGSNRKAIRSVANAHLAQIATRIEDLQRLQRVLTHLVHECEATGRTKPCPIIAALSGAHDACHPHQ